MTLRYSAQTPPWSGNFDALAPVRGGDIPVESMEPSD
jgi:hypothetical protein